ncbi:MAG: hypothetical protein ACTSVI_07675 [Promethearchaeota archaeon]
MNPQDFITFSSFPHSTRGIIKRLQDRYIGLFDDIVGFAKERQDLFYLQVDKTDEWKDINDSTVVALSWRVIFNLEVVLLLLDDDEFGREINWYFEKEMKDKIDFKWLIVIIEIYMDILERFLRDSRVKLTLLNSDNVSVDIWDFVPRDFKSNLFCFSFTKENFIPGMVVNLLNMDARSLSRMMESHEGIKDMISSSKSDDEGKNRISFYLLNSLIISVSVSLGGAGGHEPHLFVNNSRFEVRGIVNEIVILCKVFLELVAEYLQE